MNFKRISGNVDAFKIVALWCLLILSSNIQEVQGENILFYIGGLSSYSHRAGLEPLAIKLAEKGHNITFFGPLKSKSKSKTVGNITEFCPSVLLRHHEDFLRDFGTIGLQSRLKSKYNMDLGKGTALLDYGLAMCEATLTSGEFKEWIGRVPKFDLVVIDKSSMSECAYALAHKLGTNKVISYVGISFIINWDYYMYGLQPEVSWMPTFRSVYETKELSFWDRLHGEYTVLYWYLLYKYYYLPKMDKLSREELNIPEMPVIDDLIRSEAVMLLNSHYSDTFAESMPPFIVRIGGMHLEESKGNFPADLEQFLQGKNDGFIYISFGSIINISTLPPQFLTIFFEALKSFHNLRFFWKWEGNFPENVPKNVLLRKWFPQQSVLAHPKIRGFLTQGGQVSIQQAIFNAVPIIIMPVNGDQDYNAKRLRMAGNGVELEFFDLTVQKLQEAINTILKDKSYSQVASKLSKASKERPMTAVDTAVWWTEFVLRQDDVSYLKPQSMNNPWWVTQSVDVFAFVFVSLTLCLVIVVLATVETFKIISNFICKKKLKSKSNKKKSS